MPSPLLSHPAAVVEPQQARTHSRHLLPMASAALALAFSIGAASAQVASSVARLTVLGASNGTLLVKDNAGKAYASGDVLPLGARVTITAQPESRFALAAWTGNAEVLCTPDNATCTVPRVTSNLILGAQFKLATFAHPGALVDLTALQNIRKALASPSDATLAAVVASSAKMLAEQKWPTAAQLDQGAVINYTPEPHKFVYRGYTGPGLGDYGTTAGVCPDVGANCNSYWNVNPYHRDALVALDMALQYKATGRVQYGDKAVEILNAWGSRFERFASDNGNFGVELEAHIYGYLFFSAAELMRDYAGWKAADFDTFRAMAKRAFYPLMHGRMMGDGNPWGYLPKNNGWLWVWSNWYIAAVQSMAAYGVLMDDPDAFNYAVDYFKKAWTNAQADRIVYYVHPGNLGQTNESVRDQGHATLALGQLANFAQIAWSQGVDLYSYDNYRLLAGAEYQAKSNLSLPTATGWSCSESHPESCYDIPVMWYQNIPTLGPSGRGMLATSAMTALTQVYEREFGLRARYSRMAKRLFGLDGAGGESPPYSDFWATRPYSYTGTATTVSYPDLILCAGGATCTVAANTPVLYGSPSQWVSKTLSGSFKCGVDTFGVDPLPGAAKNCYTRTTTTAADVYSTRAPVLSGKSRADGVQLSWFGSYGVDNYSVQRATSAARGFQTIATGITDLLTYTDTPAQAGTYYYRVVGTDISGNAITAPSPALRLVAGQARLRNELNWCQNTGRYENDPSGSAFFGTLGSGVTRVSESGVPVLNFDGTANAFVRLPDNLNLGLGNYSVSAWVKWGGGNTWTSLLSLGNSGARNAAILLNSGTKGSAFISTLNAGTDQQTLRGPTLTQGAWTHVVLTFTGSYCSKSDSSGTCTQGGNTATLYVNGQQAAQMSGIRNDLDDIGSTTHNYLGLSQNPADNNYSGRLGNFRIYDGALGAAEVSQLYQAGMGCTGTGVGLTASYYGNIDLSGNPLLTRIETPLFNWGSGAPAAGLPADNFSVVWSGKVQAVEAGTYQFRTYADDGVRVWVDGQLVIDDWWVHAPRTTTSAGVTLAAGQQASIVVKYFENTGQALMGLYWLRPGGSWQPLPAAQLYP